VVLTVGRFVTDKGYRELAAAIPAILAAHPDVRFVWVAPVLPGEEGALPDDFLVREGLADRVVRLPLQADVRPLYVAADLLAHPTHREGVPRVLMEAAAMGLPIVTTDVPGCREVIATNVMGLLVPTRDAAALGAAVNSGLTDAAATAARAARAGAFVRDAFDADALADRIWGIYDEVLKERGTVSPGRPLPPRG
jgi:glycosyltransferase involved in cell wall biosynthesis